MLNEKLKIDTVIKNGRRTLLLRGTIDEDAHFDSILVEPDPLFIDFEGITSINALGVRCWVNFLKLLGDKKVHYENCPPVMVRQMNIVPSIVGKAEVLSVYVPYICNHCEKEVMILIKDAALDSHPVNVPGTFPCETCQKGAMEIDGQPEQYFSFKR